MIGLEGGLSTFAYVSNHPTIGIDELGLAETGAILGGGIGAGIGSGIGGGLGGTGGAAVCLPSGPGALACGAGGAAAGYVAGGLIGAGLGAAIGSEIEDFINFCIASMSSSTTECDPPKGTQCYERNEGHSHKGHDPHYHVWQMNQDNSGVCWWNKRRGRRFTHDAPPPGLEPCENYPSWVNRR